MNRWLPTAAAIALVGGTLLLSALGDPGPEALLRHQEGALQAALDRGEVQVEPAELLALMHDRSFRLRIVDLRDEGRWNWFHLADAERVDPAALDAWGEDLDYDEIVVLVDRDGHSSPAAFKRLRARGIGNSYLLDGGIEAWLAAFAPARPPAAALGGRHPASRPALPDELGYTSRVQRVGKAPVLSGGCG